MFRPCFDQLPVTKRIKRFVHDGALRAGPIAARFYFDKINHDLTPSALYKTFIRGRQISFGDLQVNFRLTLGQIFGFDNLFSSIVCKLVRLRLTVSRQ